MATIKLQTISWSVPTRVLIEQGNEKRQNGFKNPLSIDLDKVDNEVLDKMCNEFRDAVFKKAKQTDPKKAV